MPARTFAEIYCEQNGVPLPMYHAHVFRRVLFPHARLLAGVVRTLHRLHFLADHEFVEAAGHITCIADFSLPLGRFIEHPDNRRKFRRRFLVRVSARRLLRLVRSTFADSPGAVFRLEDDTLDPFDPPPRSP